MIKSLFGTEKDENAALEKALILYLNERRVASKKERGIQVTKMFMAIVGALLFLTYVGFIIFTAQGKTIMPQHDHVAVVEINGPIGMPNSAANMSIISPLLSRAFQSPTTRAVVLHINSGGGSPTEAQRIGRQAKYLSEAYGKPFYAHIDGVGASAAYMIAMHADAIYASEYSITGSIGAVISSMNFSDLAERLGVSQQAIASADAKTALSPWFEVANEQREFLQALVDSIALNFATDVQGLRGERLNMDMEDLLKALVYTSHDADELGLIDGVGTLEEVIREEFGLPRHRLEPRRNLYELLVTMTADAFAGALISHFYSEKVSM